SYVKIFKVCKNCSNGGGRKMAVKIRLKRMGDKKNPFYRIVVADSRYQRNGRNIEEIGTYNPASEPATVKVDEEKALDWMLKGANPSDKVRYLVFNQGLMEKLHYGKNNKVESDVISLGLFIESIVQPLVD